MTRSARYLIAQHVGDLFRNEPRNVGVFVAIDNHRTSRFFGEAVPGKIDGRSIKDFEYPDVYRQWVEYWNETLARAPDPIDTLLQSSGHHYRVVDGGVVQDIGNDSVHDVAAFLFSSLVGSGSMGQALGGEDEETVTSPLQQELIGVFGDNNILSDDESPLFPVKNPIRRNTTVQGRAAKHTVAFYQQNGHPVLMEAVDLTSNRKTALRDHAGLVAYMFADILSRNDSAEAIAIARLAPDAQQDKTVSYAIDMLKGSNARIINWLSQPDREEFMRARVATANE